MDVDFTFISAREGGQQLKAYVPNASGSQSGVTIATGFDLGARSSADLQKLGLGTALMSQLSTYCGIKGTAAAAKLKTDPLSITKTDADAIDKASKGQALTQVEQRYNSATSVSGGAAFGTLPREAQTVIASVAFQYGDLKSRCPSFWKHIIKADWVNAVKELRNFGDAYGPRRALEADLLEKVTKAGGTTPKATPPPNTQPKNVTFEPKKFVSWNEMLTGGNQCVQTTLAGQVGLLVANYPEDVKLVKRLLNKVRPAPLMPLSPDSHVTQEFINAIGAFQRQIGMKAPDCVIDPGGHTWKALNGQIPSKAQVKTEPAPVSQISKDSPAVTTAVTVSGEYWFPFKDLTKWSWETDPLRFGSGRTNKNGTKRAHGGCDLYYPLKTEIHAVGDGTVLEWNQIFYCQTSALVIDHGEFTIRYGEVEPKQMLKKGDKVTRGQLIGRVGLLVGITVKSPMLHLEMYSGKEKGSLTDYTARSAKRKDGVSFQRRPDLMDPTPYLNVWKDRRPT